MSDYVDKIAPEHSRTSCDDENLYNAAYGIEDFDGKGRCYRCTLLEAQRQARIEDAALSAAGQAAEALVEALEAVETLFAPYAKDSTQKDWLDKARAALAAHKAGGWQP